VTKLTDEDLESMAHDYERGTVRDSRVNRLVAEIRELRAAQLLTTDERKALQTLREDVEEFGTPTLSKRHCAPLLAVLNRLLAPTEPAFMRMEDGHDK